ncbi:MAG: S8 family serine peptidase [Thermoplasmatales archaeon]|nr:MAG: S8 family serine peptidase [Thermoplasmatales archaeon]
MKIKKQYFLSAILIVIGLVLSNASGFANSLEYKNEEIVSVLVYLEDQVDLESITNQMDEQRASLQLRHETVVTQLQKTASESQIEIVEYLNELQDQELVKDYKCFWIGNIIRVDTYQSIVDEIEKRGDVLKIYPNYQIELIEPIYKGPENEYDFGREVEPGVEAVRAPEVWDMGITGEGVLVATIDTGVDGDHPALASRWAGVADPRYEGHPEWAWLDSYAGNNDFPFDYSNHGTHTMGTVCGGDPGDQIGVAPGAYWISAGWDYDNVAQFTEDMIEAFQWLADPDGNPETNWDVPDVCSNSWGLSDAFGVPDCDETFWTYLDACEAAGTVIIFSAGNEAYQGLRRPADRATDDYRCFAVAAVDGNNPSWPIADFSSRGPTYCTPDGSEAIKPDIAAPGVNVRSSIPGGGYNSFSGTSMASPHINGVVALMRQAAPNMSVDNIKQIIFDTAYDLGDGGEDNDYGWGMIDAYEAIMNCNEAPSKPVIDGPTNGTVGTSYDYTISTEDPEGDDVYFWVDWGDSTNSGWIGPYLSGEEVTVSHLWESEGDYEILAKSKDESYESPWSNPLLMNILPLFQVDSVEGGFFKLKAVLKNNGEEELTCVEWSINLEGGAFIGKQSSGQVDIPPGGEITIQSGLIIGFGETDITVTANVPECSDTVNKGGFVYLIYIQVNIGG